MGGGLTVVLAVAFLMSCIVGAAEPPVVLYMPHSGDVLWVSPTRGAEKKPVQPTHHIKAGGVTFNVTYTDEVNNNDFGFDDPALGASRQSVVTSVLEYVGSILNESGTCDIVFQASQSDGTGNLATMGPFFFVQDGYTAGFAQTHIMTNVDPSIGSPDIQGTVDFGFSWNSTLDPPTVDEFDLFSVLLHETTHGLGFLSFSDSQGNSRVLDQSSQPSHLFGFVDKFMITGNGKDFFANDAITPTFLGVAGDLIGDDNGLLMDAAFATQQFGAPPPLHSPNPFRTGTSLSHWASGISGGAVMEPSITKGEALRIYSNLDLGALRDFGYANVVLPALDTDDDGLSDDDELNIYNTLPDDPDTDDDGLLDGDEVNTYHTQPLNPDTDGDGVSDGVEVQLGTDPLVDEPAIPADLDGDGFVTAVDVQLVINAALGIPIGDIDADVDNNGSADAVDVQLVINAALAG